MPERYQSGLGLATAEHRRFLPFFNQFLPSLTAKKPAGFRLLA